MRLPFKEPVVPPSTMTAPTRTPAPPPESRGLKYDDGKPELSLIAPEFVRGLGAVLTYGKRKYAAHNWRHGIAYSRVLSSALRHLMDVIEGRDSDEETGLPSVDHLAACVMFLSAYQKAPQKYAGFDDRFKPESKGETE